jgi:hypothetical protein
MDRAVSLIEKLVPLARHRGHEDRGRAPEEREGQERTPVIFMEIPARGLGGDTVLLYGHLDKQPEFSGGSRASVRGPGACATELVRPRRRGRRLRRVRVAHRDRSAEAQKVPHARCVVLIEACEESGSYDLPSTSTRSRSASAT